MKAIQNYLTFNGNSEEAFAFYRSVFGGEYASLMRFGEMPPEENFPIPEEMKNNIMHLTLAISDSLILMGSDSMNPPEFSAGNNFSIYLATDSKEEADKLFSNLSDGGEVTMPIMDTFWGSYFGSLNDRFGIGWMISFDAVQE